jgi:hypothetical protein
VIARQIYTDAEYYGMFQPLGLEAQQAMLATHLRGTRHLLILDNLESITGAQLAIQHMLPEAEQAALRRLLAELAGGKTLALLSCLAPFTSVINTQRLLQYTEQLRAQLALAALPFEQWPAVSKRPLAGVWWRHTHRYRFT